MRCLSISPDQQRQTQIATQSTYSTFDSGAQSCQTPIRQPSLIDVIKTGSINSYGERIFLFCDTGIAGFGKLNIKLSLLAEGGCDHEKNQQQEHHINQRGQADIGLFGATRAPLALFFFAAFSSSGTETAPA